MRIKGKIANKWRCFCSCYDLLHFSRSALEQCLLVFFFFQVRDVGALRNLCMCSSHFFFLFFTFAFAFLLRLLYEFRMTQYFFFFGGRLIAYFSSYKFGVSSSSSRQCVHALIFPVRFLFFTVLKRDGYSV